MARRDYLSAEERTRFDAPPPLNSSQRLILLDLPHWAETYLAAIHTPTAKVGFVLQLGYFRVVTRFFVPDRFTQADIDWVCGQLLIPRHQVNLAAYGVSRTLYRHRTTILAQLGYQPFDEQHRQELGREAQLLTHLQTRPAQMLDALVDYLRQQRIETPSYSLLRDIITQALDAFDGHLQTIIQQHLTAADQAMLDGLVDNSPPAPEGKGRYPLTDLKQISQSMQPKAIAERVALFNRLKTLFIPLAPLIARLDLTDDTIRYYAQYVLDNRSVRLAERVHERYLRLMAFITHQYLSVGDALILTLHKAVSGVLTDCDDRMKEEYYQSRQATASLVGQVSRRADVHIDALTEIEQTIDKTDWTSDEKVGYIRQILERKRLTSSQLLTDKQRVADLKTINQPIDERTDYYQALEKASFRLQLRVTAIVQVLQFDAESSHPHLIEAITYYQQQRGELTASAKPPLAFLDMAQRQHVFTEKGKLRVSLYKILLFRAIRDGLRDGTLTVLSSYEYRSVDEYQIPRSQWRAYREEYLRRAGLLAFSQPAPTLMALGERVNGQFEQTNGRLDTNEQVFYDAHGGWHLHRYRADESETQQATRQLYPVSRVITLREVLLQIEQLTGFLGKFQHQGFPHKPTRPDVRLLLAAIIGYGENIGIRKMALISKDISVHTLETVATQYFSPEKVLEANDCIVAHSNALPLTDLFRRKEGFVMTGSDGQKYDVSVPSLRASASYKYFGNGEGVCVYSGLDEAGQLLYTVVINAAERESGYVLDVVLHNPVLQTEAHATDMHGFSEINFAVMGLLGIDFRPRFVQPHRQQLYSLDAVGTFKSKGYKIVPSSRVDYEHLVAYWDDILRFVASQKLGYVRPSTLLKRLNSYAKQHPLHKALRDLGRLYKTDLILRVVDDAGLRASIEGMLSKVEHSNKFSNAVTLGNNGSFDWPTQADRDTASGCRMLIMNAINFYNLLYLSEKLRVSKTTAEREELLTTILQSSTHTWHHINLAGEYDFSDGTMPPSPFDLKMLMDLPLARPRSHNQVLK
ncbi:Tn3 family transposase [Rudanella lutea]|uniref:Tn3 family transposase n=1 Tax=Rudanella lutea TaxID=451374 RepID=UPI0003694D26|nr:Tn3 family transposase [Rudanella lutea]